MMTRAPTRQGTRLSANGIAARVQARVLHDGVIPPRCVDGAQRGVRVRTCATGAEDTNMEHCAAMRWSTTLRMRQTGHACTQLLETAGALTLDDGAEG